VKSKSQRVGYFARGASTTVGDASILRYQKGGYDGVARNCVAAGDIGHLCDMGHLRDMVRWRRDIDRQLDRRRCVCRLSQQSSSDPGRLIAQGNDWGITYSLPSISLAPGTYYLNIEVTNYGGPGGLIGDFTVGGRHLLTDTTEWFANRGFLRTGAPATGKAISQGFNGVAPWGRHPGISSSAQWIDAALGGLSSCGVCTVEFSAKITVPAVLGASRRSAALRRQPRRPLVC
jgi:hypothetical protein